MVKVKKLKKAEKAKVKLKATKLPKGQNVTDTSFRSKIIVLPRQLKDVNKKEVCTRKKLHVKELLTHLGHHNIPMRREGLSGLKELITLHEDVIKLHLRRVIDNVARLVLDTESELRKSAVKLIETILYKVSSMEIAPHFKVLKTYMSCAMTHINVSIREDSLLLMDSLLNACPLLMVKEADDILPTFLNMISNMKNQLGQSRRISFDVNNKMTGVHWRMQVYARLTKYFAAMVRAKKHGIEDSPSMDVEVVSESNSNIVKWSESSTFYAAEFMSFRKEVCHLPCVFSNDRLTRNNAYLHTVNHGKALQSHVRSLMPVLFESWIEVSPELNSAEVSILSEEAAVMLQYVLEVLQHIWDSLQSWDLEANSNDLGLWFKKEYEKIILKAFLPGFPFALRENVFSPKSVPKKNISLLKEEQTLVQNMKSLDMKCTPQNLLFCYLLVSMNNEKNKALEQPVNMFLKNCIAKSDYIDYLPMLDKILRVLIIDHKSAWSRTEVLQAVVKKCHERSIPTQLRQVLFSVLCDFLMQPGSLMELRCQEFKEWVSELPYTLFQSEVSVQTVKALLLLSNQNHETFMNGLRRRSKAIINSLCEIPITGYSNPFEAQKCILNMIFHVTDPDSFNYLLKRIGDSQEHKELVSYVNNMKQFREHVLLYN